MDSEIVGKESRVARIGTRNVIIVLMLGIAGQIAWAVENSWFNTFVFDELTPDPRSVAWMVAVSAITATITTLLMGTFSDRTYTKFGRRRPYILFGYIIWGLITAIFPMVAFIQLVGVAVVTVIILDAVMTFFGSTANDAAYNAWITDISESSNRNRIQSINSITAVIANLIAIGAAGYIIDTYGYFTFFFFLGGFVSISGLIAGLIVKEPLIPVEKREPSQKLWRALTELLSFQSIRRNKVLYLLFLNMALNGIASQVYFPYLFIYLEHFLGFTKPEISIVGAVILLASTLILIIVGIVSHRFNRKSVLLIAIIVGAIFLFIFSFLRNMWLASILYLFQTAFSLTAGVIHSAWLQDRYPEGNIGKFQGVRLIFMVLLPMVIGPPIGSIVISSFGIPITIDNIPGYIPTPEIFFIGAIISLLALIPVLFIKKSEGKIQFKQE